MVLRFPAQCNPWRACESLRRHVFELAVPLGPSPPTVAFERRLAWDEGIGRSERPVGERSVNIRVKRPGSIISSKGTGDLALSTAAITTAEVGHQGDGRPRPPASVFGMRYPASGAPALGPAAAGRGGNLIFVPAWLRATHGSGLLLSPAERHLHTRWGSPPQEGGCARGLSSSCEARTINRDIIDAASGHRYRDILKVVEQHLQRFDHVNVVTALHRLASCRLESGSREARQLLADPRFAQLERLGELHVPSFTGRQVAACLWALAKLGYQQTGAAGGGPVQRDDAMGGSGSSGGGQRGRNGSGRKGRDGVSLLVERLSGRIVDVSHELPSQAVSQALWALGKLGHHPGEAPLQALTGRLLQVLPAARPQEVTNSFLGWAKLGWSPGPDVLDQVAHGSMDKIGDFEPQHLSNMLWCLAQLGHRNTKLQDAIFGQALARICEFNPQGIANLVWAVATLGLGPGGSSSSSSSGDALPGAMPAKLLLKCCDRAVATLQDFNSQDISNLLWAAATLGCRHEPLLQAAARQAARQLAAETAGADGGGAIVGARGRRPGWSSQGIAITMWSYATLGADPGSEFLTQVCRHLSSRRCLARYGWRAMANTLWALAVLQHRDPRALAAVEEEVVARMQVVGTTAAAVAAVAAVAASHIKEPESDERSRPPGARPPLPQDVSNLLWAYATLQHTAPGLFAALLPTLEQRINEFSGIAISNSLWAAARLGVYDSRIMDVVAEHLSGNDAPALNMQSMAIIMWAYGELRHAHRPLFDQLVARTVACVPYTRPPLSPASSDPLNPQDLTGVCAAAGRFGWRYPALLDAVECYVRGDLKSSGSGSRPTAPHVQQLAATRHLCALAWGLSLVGGCSPGLWEQLMELMERSIEAHHQSAKSAAEALTSEGLSQLFQARMYIRMDHPTAVLAAGPPGLLNEAERVWRGTTREGARVSDLQRKVAAALTRRGLSYTEERLTDDGLFSIDLAVEFDVKAEVEAKAEAKLLGRPQVPAVSNGGCSGCTTSGTVGSGIQGSSGAGAHEQLVRVAVEVDGPFHFTANTWQPLATTVYRHRCLQERGWHVVSVPYWRWITAGESSGQDALLSTLMREAGLGELLTAAAAGTEQQQQEA